MSCWTQVVAVFRCGGTIIGDEYGADWERALGKFVAWESPSEVWDERCEHPELFTPTGREGGIEWRVIDDSREFDYVADQYKVVAFGSLRDFSDLDEVGRWFSKCCGNLFVRQAVLEAYNDFGECKVMTLSDVKE